MIEKECMKKKYKVECTGDGLSPETAYTPVWLSDPDLADCHFNYLKTPKKNKNYFVVEIEVTQAKHDVLKVKDGVEETEEGVED